MDIKIAQQMTITELVLENQKMKLDAQREAEHHDRMVGELEKVYKERDKLKQLLAADSENVDAYLGVCIERDEAREHLREIAEYGTQEINAAVELRQKLATALVERDEARAFLLQTQELCHEYLDAKIKAERERDEAREALSDWENSALHVEADHPNEKHCGCVPVLRKLLNEARSELSLKQQTLTIAEGTLSDLRKEWQTLCSWGGTPEHIHDFIKGQQTRIHQAQEIEKTCEQLEHSRDEWAAMCGRYKQERDIAEADATNHHARIIELIAERDKAKQERDIAEDERIDMAQQLESEKQCHDRCQNERDALVQKLDAWEEIAEHLHHLVQHPAYGVDQAIQRMDVLEAYKHLKHGH